MSRSKISLSFNPIYLQERKKLFRYTSIAMTSMARGLTRPAVPRACTADVAPKNFCGEEVMPTRLTLGGEHAWLLAGKVVWGARGKKMKI